MDSLLTSVLSGFVQGLLIVAWAALCWHIGTLAGRLTVLALRLWDGDDEGDEL